MTKKEIINKALEIFEQNKKEFKKEFKKYCFNENLTKDLLEKYINAEFKHALKHGWSIEKTNKHFIENYLNLDYILHSLRQFQYMKTALLQKRLVINSVSDNGKKWSVRYVLKNNVLNFSPIHLMAICSYNFDVHKGIFIISDPDPALKLILTMSKNLGLKDKQVHQDQQIFYN